MTPRILVNAAWPSAPPTALDESAGQVVAAGGDGLALPDSPRVFADPLVLTERMLTDPQVPLAGPCALGMGLRHPATVAGALRTLADAHPARVFAVLARGESAVRNEGLAPPRLEDYLGRIDHVAGLLGAASRHLTLLGAASGPRTLTATATRLPGVLIDVGTHPEVVGRAVATARAARGDVSCWLFLRAVTTRSDAQRRAAVAPLLGSCAARLTAAPQWYRVPSAVVGDLQRLAAAHNYTRHGYEQEASAGAAAELVEDRYFVTGAAADLSAAVGSLAATGIDGVVLAGAVGGLPERLVETVRAVAGGLAERGRPSTSAGE